jgi:hypothetical protein
MVNIVFPLTISVAVPIEVMLLPSVIEYVSLLGGSWTSIMARFSMAPPGNREE